MVRPFRGILKYALLTVLFLVSLTSQATEYERKALIIGNSNYTTLESLSNPLNDATAIAKALGALEFDVDLLIDASLDVMKNGVGEFQSKLNSSTVSVIYYAGHGVQNDGTNYLIPSDATIEKTGQLAEQSLSLDRILSSLDKSESPLKIVLLDACRDNPLKSQLGLPRSIRQPKGLAEASSASGTILSYATAPNRIAYDGEEGKHSPYAKALLKHIGTPGVTVVDMLNRVGIEVEQDTFGKQTPWQYISPIDEFCFSGCVSTANSADLTTGTPPTEQEPTPSGPNRWLYIGLGVLAVGAAAALSGGGSTEGPSSETIETTVTTPLP